MKARQYSFLLLPILFAGLLGCKTTRPAVAKKFVITLTNPSSIERADELVVLTREMIEQKTGPIAAGNYVDITTVINKPIIIQFDDLNRDGQWDEAVFLSKFEPSQKVTLNISIAAGSPQKTTARAHVRMRKKNDDNSFGPLLDSVSVPAGTLPTDFSKQKLPLYLTEGPAWENDKVAFRLYLDSRNTKDIYGKLTPKMMMDTVGANPAENYHKLSRWGMDILAVGKSLGAGSLAVRIPVADSKDTMVRLGGNNIGKTTYMKIADGPVRAIFQMHYSDWTAINGTTPIDVAEEISIWGGKYFYQSKVTVANAPQGSQLVPGIVNLQSKKLNEITAGNCKTLYTYDVQSENKDRLGLAIMAKSDQVSSFGKTAGVKTNIENTYMLVMPLTNQPVVFRFYAGWERSDLLFSHEESFRQFMTNETIKYSSPVQVQ